MHSASTIIRNYYNYTIEKAEYVMPYVMLISKKKPFVHNRLTNKQCGLRSLPNPTSLAGHLYTRMYVERLHSRSPKPESALLITGIFLSPQKINQNQRCPLNIGWVKGVKKKLTSGLKRPIKTDKLPETSNPSRRFI